MKFRIATRPAARTLAASVALLGLCGNASANLIQVEEEITTTQSVTIVTTEIHDSAEVEINGPGYTASNSVIDGHPSVADVTAPQSPWGGPYARGKAFGDGASGETWTAFMADANGPDTYDATVLKASASKTVIVENLTTTTRTITVVTIFVPEAATVAYDAGVQGDLTVIYSLVLDESTVVYNKTMSFNGTEINSGEVLKDNILWVESFDAYVGNLGGFDHAFVMDSTPIMIPIDVTLGPNESRTIQLDLENQILTPDPAATTGMGFLGAVTNSLPLDPFEPNDDPLQATPLSCGEALFEPLLGIGDIDHYFVEAPFGTIVDVTIETTEAMTLGVSSPGLGPVISWPLPSGAGISRRYVALGDGELLRIDGPVETPYTVFVTCRDPNLPLLPGDFLAAVNGTVEAPAEIVRIDPLTGAALFQAPLADPFGDITGMVFDEQRGGLVGVAPQTQMLIDIDPFTGLQQPRCELQPPGDITAIAAGPDGQFFVTWLDPVQQLLLGVVDPQPSPQGICQVLPQQPLPYQDIGALTFDPLNNLLYGCLGGQNPLGGGLLIPIDPLGGAQIPLPIPPSCGGLELMLQGTIIDPNRTSGPELLLATGPEDPAPGMVFVVDASTGSTTPIGDTGTGGIVSLVRLPGPPPPDSDGDGVADPIDNCLLVSNPAQIDADADGIGNLCDADLNNDCSVTPIDLGLFRSVFFGTDPAADFNSDGIVNPVDLGIMKAGFFMAPGPSGIPNVCDGP